MKKVAFIFPGQGSQAIGMGRIQSREYMKKITETESQKRVAYEVSVSKLECMDE